MKRAPSVTLVGFALVALPSPATAHLVNSGLGPFYDGALHLLLSPGVLLGVVAAALLAGQRGASAARLTVIALPLAWLLAGVIGLKLPGMLELTWLSVLSLAILGALVAADAKLPPVAVAGLAALYGLLQGWLDGSALASLDAGLGALGGIVATALVFTIVAAALVVPLRVFWARIAIRVAGSWVAAVGILMLGWLIA